MENLEFTSDFNEDLFDPTFSNELFFENSAEIDTLPLDDEVEDQELITVEMDFKDFIHLLHT